MIKLSRVKLVKRFAILLLCITTLGAGTFFAVKLLKTIQTNAITADGDSITISYDRNGTS